MHTLQTPQHKQTHTLKNPNIETLAHYKINTYTQPHITKPTIHTRTHYKTQNIDTHANYKFYNVHKNIILTPQSTYTHTLKNENIHQLTQ